MKLDLLRHGETELGHTLRGSTDDELTVKGWLQMQSTINQSIQYPIQWDVIFTSPLQRCQKFAQSLANQYGLKLIHIPELQEMYFGEWEGISTQEIYENSPELLSNFWQFPTRFTPPNAENMDDFVKRVLSGLDTVKLEMHKLNAKQSLIVTHGGVIKLLKCIAFQHTFDDVLKMHANLGQLNHFYFTEKHQLKCIEETVK